MKTNLFTTIACACLMFLGACATTSSVHNTRPADGVTLRDFKLTGNLAGDHANFTLTAIASVGNAKGGTLDLLSGKVALTELGKHPDWQVRVDQGRFLLTFDRSGDFPVTLKFSAAVGQRDGWNAVDFRVAPSPLQPVMLQGLAADTQFAFAGAARPELAGADFKSFLPADGTVKLSWKEGRPETEGKLFYAAEMLSQISLSPGLMRQVALLDCKVMQGELTKVTFLLRGAGEVTRVQGQQLLSWRIEPVTNSSDRRLVVQLNQPQKEEFSLLVQLQTPLGAFPQLADVVRLQPEGATRFAGYYRVVNDGAVRLEVTQASGLSQISPEQFPESDATKTMFHATGSQRFAYRFSGADFAMKVQADQILPELGVSQVLTYHLGESELSVDAEIELDVREAPLRELMLHIPKGYAIARLTASGLSDYFSSEPAGANDVELRLVYGQPVTGRQVVQLRLERNAGLNATNWSLPRIEVAKAKSVRGHVGVAADAGFRVTPGRTQGLTEIATAYFPVKVAGIQAGFRLSEPTWEATVNVERLPQTVQADVLHLFSIGEGIAYGSSVMNYVVSGAPVSTLHVELASEYYNVEFTGKDVRDWQKTNGGYLVQLHTPVSGPYTLLATYERPFKPQGETLAFTGARPLDAQSEQGYTLILSKYEFQVNPVDVSSGLLQLETTEVPAEYRLFFDAPILKAYRYTSRPFNLKLALSPMAQGDSLSQVVDRATFTTHISKEGQALTDVCYFVKNRGNPSFRISLPDGTQLWSATVNGTAVAPVVDNKSNLIPLPQRADPGAVLQIDLKLASTSQVASRVNVAAPTVGAPVMLAEWKLEPDTGQRLIYHKGSLTPVGGIPDVSGFAQLARMLARGGLGMVLAMAVLVGIAVVAWRWAGKEGNGRLGARHFAGIIIGLGAVALALVVFVNLRDLAGRTTSFTAPDLTIVAPVQQAGSNFTVEVGNIPAQTSEYGFGAGSIVLALLAAVMWLYALVKEASVLKVIAVVLGWTLLAWAALRGTNGAQAFLWVMLAFMLALVIPAFRQLLRLSRKPAGNSGDAGMEVVVPLIVGCLLWTGLSGTTLSAAPVQQQAKSASMPMVTTKETPVAKSVTQQVRVEDKFAIATAKIKWDAEKGQVLPLLYEPAVLTHVTYPNRALKLSQKAVGARQVQQLEAEETGVYDIEVKYQLQVVKKEGENGFYLPMPSGLVNRLDLTLANLDVDVASPQAVSVQRESSGSNTVAAIVLSPLDEAWIAWRPRSRDVKREKPVFYAEIYQLYVPSAGVVEGSHYASIRPAQGELSELVFKVPDGATITDVTDPAAYPAQVAGGNAVVQNGRASIVSLWRFDPDTRRLRVNFNHPQSRPFALLIRSQVPTGTLPFEQSVGLVAVEGAAEQIGLLGLATGNEVQLDTVTANDYSPINLEDFPTVVVQPLEPEFPGLTVRRAYSYKDTKLKAAMKASAVEPDVVVETQTTLSLGEDRVVLAANASVEITRAGIFRLSFLLPDGMDVESVSGDALSHWTELKTDSGRVITLHLRGKTEGKHQFVVTLSGPGVRSTDSWTAPQFVVREANKQRGTLLIVPEQGMQLQAATLEGLSQLDPQRSGIKQKGVLQFRVLQTPWNLALKIEQVNPWVQVTGLQHATVNEAQVKVLANLQYQIENAGLKMFHVWLPVNAEKSVHFQGDQVADYRPLSDTATNGMEQWEVKLHRRVVGPYLLQVEYQTLMAEQAREAILRGVRAADVNQQRGFVTVQAGGRLQVRPDAVPAALQPADWQSIPRNLQQDLQTASVNFAYRLVDPAFELHLKLDRFEAAKLLPARVNNVTFTSVISDNGTMLTRARLEIFPGDKRLLHVGLPESTNFWFAFVNQNGVWPWTETNEYLIPLEQPSESGKSVPVEIFFTSQAGSADTHKLDLDLIAPKFDLPLENITWRVYLNEKWQVKKWSGALQMQQEEIVPVAGSLDPQTYLRQEAGAKQAKTREAEQMLAAGNSFLQKGDQQQARRAFQSAYGLSQGDLAFNEDARVQLNNLKLQQALVGLNVRQAAANGDTAALGARFGNLRGREEVNYTQQDAKDIIDRNTADDNNAFMHLAQRLIQQQDAAMSSPAVIRANIPEQGQVLTFKRAVVVSPRADLEVHLNATALKAASGKTRLSMLAGTFVALLVLAWAGTMRKSTAAA